MPLEVFNFFVPWVVLRLAALLRVGVGRRTTCCRG